MSDRRRGLGRGLGALIPTGPSTEDRRAWPASAPSPVDVFFPSGAQTVGATGSETADGPRPATMSGSDVAGRGGPDADTAATVGATGRGPDADGAPIGAYFREIPLDAVVPNPRQPRQVFDEDALAELVASIRAVGLLQPVVVRPAGGRFELVMGERRWRAARAAGLDAVPAIVRETDDTVLLRDALLENLHRSELNPLEEAAAYDQLLQDFGCTHEELAERIGRSRPQISNTLRLLRLPAPVQRRVAAGVLSAGHARALLGIDDPGAQQRLAARIVAEGLSVRAVEEIVAVGDASIGPATQRQSRSRRPVSPGLAELAERLSDRFETRVKVDLGKTKGRITIDFASVDDLERIVAAMGETLRRADGAASADGHTDPARTETQDHADA
ncbi:MAG: ParB/RepB/Spo0J family partition protein [Actinomycetota bacterium]|nr:ParB/RepB/Spo0J family partition protein [Actinomycetota bacterium]